MKFNNRPYQGDAIKLLGEAIIKAKPKRCIPILGMPTGAGKTVTFSMITERAQKKGRRVGVVCHRNILANQAKDTMHRYGLNPLMIYYGTVQTYVRSPHKIPEVDLWIIDECHIGNFRKFVDLIPENVQIVGATATPISASNKTPLRDTFTDVVYPVQISELIELGFLSSPVYHVWEIEESKLEKDFRGDFTEESQSKVFHIDNLVEAFDRRIGKTIIFTSSIKQAEAVLEAIGSRDDSKVFLVHSKMKEDEVLGIIDEYKNTTNATIVNCSILTAGFDDPSLETVIIYRATTSVALWLQMCGRCSRIIEGIKSKFYIFDMGNNRKRLLAWEADRDWPAIFDLQGRKVKDKEAPMKKCANCEAVIYASAIKCPYCGAVQPRKVHKPVKATSIKVIDSYSELPSHLKKDFDKMSVKELVERAQYGSPGLGRPYKTGWIISQLKSKPDFTESIQEFARIKGYKQGWVKRQLEGFNQMKHEN